VIGILRACNEQHFGAFMLYFTEFAPRITQFHKNKMKLQLPWSKPDKEIKTAKWAKNCSLQITAREQEADSISISLVYINSHVNNLTATSAQPELCR
jgi:hypothetical protein